MRRSAILYDADCGFCLWTLHKVLALDRRGRLRPVALQDPEADPLLGGMTQEVRMASWHLVEPDGTVHSAGAAFPPLFRLLPGGRPFAALTGAFPRASERAYRFVANNRDRLGPLVRRFSRSARPAESPLATAGGPTGRNRESDAPDRRPPRGAPRDRPSSQRPSTGPGS